MAVFNQKYQTPDRRPRRTCIDSIEEEEWKTLYISAYFLFLFDPVIIWGHVLGIQEACETLRLPKISSRLYWFYKIDDNTQP